MSAPLDRATILGGGSVRVVLDPDPNRPEVTATVENLALPHLYIQEDKVIGVSAYNHSWHLDGTHYDPKLTAAYAYSNFCGLVFNASLALGVVRGYHVSLYSKIEFVVVPDFEEIWRLDGNGGVEAVRDAVRAGRRLKIAIEDDSGLTVVHPVHMAEVLLDRHEFICFTDQTAHPAIFRTPDAIQAMSNEIAGRLLEVMHTAATVDSNGATQFDISSPVFESAYYIVKADGMAARGQNLGEELQFAKYRSVTIFASRDFVY